ncbi:MAG: PD40 domain-containing protein [Bacteroidales bacterium]|nr:PD40 domain-containing protein [Bacteroidales bacterium]
MNSHLLSPIYRTQNLIAGVFLVLLLSLSIGLKAQNANSVLRNLKGNQTFPSWSPDGRYLLYQSDVFGNQDVFLLDVQTDSVHRLTFAASNEEHPVWVPGKNAVVYDSKRNGKYHLYLLDLNTGKERLLFHRNVEAREASFTPNRQLVVFSGLTPVEDSWGIFSYDFVYNNLNTLIRPQGNAGFPVVSPGGRKMVYQLRNVMNRTIWYQANWYGDDQQLVNHGSGRPAWSPDAWRLYYAGKDAENWSVYSVRRNGQSVLRVATYDSPVSDPAVSPDGKQLAFSLKTKNGWKIQIIKLGN